MDFQEEINQINQPSTHQITEYTVRAITDLVYFRISRALYQAARNATIFEKSQLNKESRTENKPTSHLKMIAL